MRCAHLEQHLSGGVIVRDVEPQPMADSRRHAFPQAEWVATDKVGPLPVGIIQGIEEVWGGWGKQVLDVLLQGVDVLQMHPGETFRSKKGWSIASIMYC